MNNFKNVEKESLSQYTDEVQEIYLHKLILLVKMRSECLSDC